VVWVGEKEMSERRELLKQVSIGAIGSVVLPMAAGLYFHWIAGVGPDYDLRVPVILTVPVFLLSLVLWWWAVVALIDIRRRPDLRGHPLVILSAFFAVVWLIAALAIVAQLLRLRK
jgi:hypothetical protein